MTREQQKWTTRILTSLAVGGTAFFLRPNVGHISDRIRAFGATTAATLFFLSLVKDELPKELTERAEET